jgi:hypothetical protein
VKRLIRGRFCDGGWFFSGFSRERVDSQPESSYFGGRHRDGMTRFTAFCIVIRNEYSSIHFSCPGLPPVCRAEVSSFLLKKKRFDSWWQGSAHPVQP